MSSWTRVIAGLGLLMIVTASIADDVRKPGVKDPTASRAPALAVAAQAAADVRPAFNVICVTSVQCFSTKAPASASNAHPVPLDLRAPDIRRVFSEAELQQTLHVPEEEHDIQETVQIEGQRQLRPVSIGILAIPWAIMHPTQAWRILTPMTDAK